MLTTNDIKLKDTKPEKLTIIQTGRVKPKGFIVKGKSKPRDKRIVTTSNVEEYQRKLKRKKPTGTRDSGRDE